MLLDDQVRFPRTVWPKLQTTEFFDRFFKQKQPINRAETKKITLYLSFKIIP